MNTFRILNLGAGTQSSAIYSLMTRGEIEPADYAVFSDTQEEPAWVYRQLQYCKYLRDMRGGPPIVEVTAGLAGDYEPRPGDNAGPPIADLATDETIQRLMPHTVAQWTGDKTPVDYPTLRDEDAAYGRYLLAEGISHDGMFFRRCTAAAHRQFNATQSICEAITTFDLVAFLERLARWQTR